MHKGTAAAVHTQCSSFATSTCVDFVVLARDVDFHTTSRMVATKLLVFLMGLEAGKVAIASSSNIMQDARPPRIRTRPRRPRRRATGAQLRPQLRPRP